MLAEQSNNTKVERIQRVHFANRIRVSYCLVGMKIVRKITTLCLPLLMIFCKSKDSNEIRLKRMVVRNMLREIVASLIARIFTHLDVNVALVEFLWWASFLKRTDLDIEMNTRRAHTHRAHALLQFRQLWWIWGCYDWISYYILCGKLADRAFIHYLAADTFTTGKVIASKQLEVALILCL